MRDGRPVTTSWWAATVAAAGGLLMIGSAFLPWISTDTQDGGTTTITGWGGIGGASEIAGANLNDVLAGAGTYRPGLIGLVLGVLTVLDAIAGRSPHRVTAALLVLFGLVGAGWGLYRGIDPGDAGVFAAGEVSAAAGPWLTAAGGLLAIVAGGLIFTGRIDPPGPTVRRGIQPR